MKKLNSWKKLNLLKFRLSRTKLYSVFMLSIFNYAYASSSDNFLPAEAILKRIAAAISGPIALSVATIFIVVMALLNTFVEFGEGMKKLVTFGFWLSIAFGASSIISNFGGTGAVF